MCDNAFESENGSNSNLDKMDTSEEETLCRSEPNDEDHECDSNFMLKRHKAVRPVDENNESSSHKAQTQSTHEIKKEENAATVDKISSSPLITQKQNTTPYGCKMPKVMHVKPKINTTSSSSSLTSSHQPRHLDKIVTNLKINLLQQMSKMKAEKDNENMASSEPPLKKHELFIKIVETLQPKPKSSENPDEYDDLTDLTWLTNFNLTKEMGPHFALGCLSPPQSPPHPSPPKSSPSQHQLLHVNTKTPPHHHHHHHRSNHTLNTTSTTTKINPKIAQVFNLNFDLKYGDDEADGASSKPLSNFNILSLIKPWVPAPASPQANSSKAQRSQSSPPTPPPVLPQRPPYSFSCLTFLAIESSERKRLSVKEIYAWIIQNFPYYHSVPSGSWKNSIRHNLSYNQCFCKVDKNLLAMRDFSGKGSLWCINPEFRPLLIEMLQKTPTHEQHKLACIPFLQDVAETTQPILTPPSASASKSSHTSIPIPAQNFIKKKSVAQLNTPTIINPKILSQLISPKTTRLQVATPVITSKNSATNLSNMPRVSSVSKTSLKAKNASFSSGEKESSQTPIKTSSKQTSSSKLESPSNISFSDNCSEMDAVNALLTMKSRSSSMPVASMPQLNEQSDQIKDLNKKGRRKQLLRPPTKNVFSKSPTNFDENSGETHLGDDCFDMNSDSSEDRLYEKGPNKLVVKFPAFVNHSKASDTPVRHLNIKANDDDDDYNEESVLKIDEGVQDEPEDLSLKKNTIQDQRKNVKKRKMTNPDLNNALLELSRAAKHVEDSKICIKKL